MGIKVECCVDVCRYQFDGQCTRGEIKIGYGVAEVICETYLFENFKREGSIREEQKPDFDSDNAGSNPASPAIQQTK